MKENKDKCKDNWKSTDRGEIRKRIESIVGIGIMIVYYDKWTGMD